MTTAVIYPRPNSDKSIYTIYIRCTVKRGAHSEPTKVRVPVACWNPVLNRVVPDGTKVTEKKAEELNKKILETYNKVENTLKVLHAEDDLRDFRRLLKKGNKGGIYKKDLSLIELFDITIEHSRLPDPKRYKKDGGLYSETTLGQYAETQKALKTFEEEQHVRLNNITYLNTDFYNDFKNYLYSIKKPNSKNKDSNVGKHIKHINSVVNYIQNENVVEF